MLHGLGKIWFDRNLGKMVWYRNGLLTKKNAPTRFQGFLRIVKS
jgi:hypothetical protein